MKKYLIVFTGIILALSIIGNIYFLMGKGIVVNNTYHHESFNDLRQFQSQGMISVAMYAIQGQMVWKEREFKDKKLFKDNYLDAVNYLNQLPIEISLFSSINTYYIDNNNYMVSLVYPVVDDQLMEKMKERQDWNKVSK